LLVLPKGVTIANNFFQENLKLFFRISEETVETADTGIVSFVKEIIPKVRSICKKNATMFYFLRVKIEGSL
jgi:hypothetical protein